MSRMIRKLRPGPGSSKGTKVPGALIGMRMLC